MIMSTEAYMKAGERTGLGTDLKILNLSIFMYMQPTVSATHEYQTFLTTLTSIVNSLPHLWAPLTTAIGSCCG